MARVKRPPPIPRRPRRPAGSVYGLADLMEYVRQLERYCDALERERKTVRQLELKED